MSGNMRPEITVACSMPQLNECNGNTKFYNDIEEKIVFNYTGHIMSDTHQVDWVSASLILITLLIQLHLSYTRVVLPIRKLTNIYGSVLH